MPHTDLLVSPDHAIFVDGRLICARQLINGTTIRQEKDWTSVEYFHVELDAHAILLAEGLPAESYLNTGNHGFFANSGAAAGAASRPDGRDRLPDPRGGLVRAVRVGRGQRAAGVAAPGGACGGAGPAGAAARRRPPIRGCASWPRGGRVRPLYGENGLYIFALPKGATEVRLVSRAGSPTDTRPWLEDRRCLGVYVERIVLRGASEVREVPLDHPGLSQGWWAVEQDGADDAPVDGRRCGAAAARDGWPDDAGDPRRQRGQWPI